MKTLMSTSNNPWTLFSDRLFDDLVYPSFLGRKLDTFPKYDVRESEKFYLMSFDLPGVKKDDLKIEVKDGLLTLSGERKSEQDVEGYSERFYGNFERSFSLPENVDAENVEAHYEDGVLKVALPKLAAKSAKRIEIKQGEDGKAKFSKLLNHFKKEKDSEAAA